jgi:DNA polymerase III epsilon subunit-like protein
MKRIFLDTETTGLLKPSAAGLDAQPFITEIYMVKVDENYEVIEELDSFINIPIAVPDFITKITGITSGDLSNAPTWEEIAPEIDAFITDADETVAHNHQFDKAMILNQFIRAGYTHFDWPASEICTVQHSMALEQRRINLQRLHELLLGRPFPDAHRAKSDVTALVRCHFAMAQRGMV